MLSDSCCDRHHFRQGRRAGIHASTTCFTLIVTFALNESVSKISKQVFASTENFFLVLAHNIKP